MAVRDEGELAFEATVDAVIRTRRVLMLVSVVIAIGYFHLWHWYNSWELARIDARLGIAAAIKERNAAGVTVTGRLAEDSIQIQQLFAETDRLQRMWGEKTVTVPLLGLPVAVTDLSVALMMISAAVLLWLLFYQRRVEWALARLEKLQGWEIAKGVLEYHFVLMGSHASRPMRIAARGLVWGLPILCVAFLASDLYDLRKIAIHELNSLAFESAAFHGRVFRRIGIDGLLVVANLVLGVSCFRAYRQAEERVLRFANEGTGKP